MKKQVIFSDSNHKLDLTFGNSIQTLDMSFREVQHITEYVGGELYQGEYEVKPKLTEQTLPTSQKVMLNDVTIQKIPVTRVSNTSGGNTVIIGS